MRSEIKFQKKEQGRRRLALLLAIMLHLVVFAAISYQSEIKDYLPDVLQEYFAEPETEVPVEPQA